MDRRRFLLTSLAGGVAAPIAAGAQAQRAAKVYRIGLLGPSDARSGMPYVDAFRHGMRELGWAEGNNFVIEYRWADGKLERLPELAADLVRMKVDIIVTGAGAANQPAKDATKTIPIIMAAGANPVETGLVASLAQPGGNITGLSLTAGPEIAGKNVELLKEAVPKASRVAVLVNATNPAAAPLLREAERAAQTLAVTLQMFPVRGLDNFDTAFSAMTRGKASVLLILSDVLFWVHQARLVELLKRSQLPTMWAGSGAREFVTAGALMGYGPSLPDLFRRAAAYADKILKGAKPAALPIEQPIKFELIINRKTAKALGLTIPPSLLARADQVIDQ